MLYFAEVYKYRSKVSADKNVSIDCYSGKVELNGESIDFQKFFEHLKKTESYPCEYILFEIDSHHETDVEEEFNLGKEILGELIRKSTKLRFLNIAFATYEYNPLPLFLDKMLPVIASCPELEYLRIDAEGEATMVDANVQAVAAFLSTNRNIKGVELTGHVFTENNIQALLAAINNSQTLLSLSLAQDKRRSEAKFIALIEGLRINKTLQEVSYSDDHQEDGSEVKCSWLSLCKLKSLFSQNKTLIDFTLPEEMEPDTNNTIEFYEIQKEINSIKAMYATRKISMLEMWGMRQTIQQLQVANMKLTAQLNMQQTQLDNLWSEIKSLKSNSSQAKWSLVPSTDDNEVPSEQSQLTEGSAKRFKLI
jgi:hypothetical protein